MKKSARSLESLSAYRLRPVAAAIAALLLPAAAFSQAKPASDEVLDDVVVTGIRHSIETSVAIKRESESIVEVLTAEDIGKLPDTSIADSLARLPGLEPATQGGRLLAQRIDVVDRSAGDAPGPLDRGVGALLDRDDPRLEFATSAALRPTPRHPRKATAPQRPNGGASRRVACPPRESGLKAHAPRADGAGRHQSSDARRYIRRTSSHLPHEEHLMRTTDVRRSALAATSLPRVEVLSYSEHSLGQGSEARAVSYIQIRTDRGHSLFGAGIDTNIELASIKAIVSALNRALAKS